MASTTEQMDSLIPSADNEYLPTPEQDFSAADFASDTWEQARKRFRDAGIINVDPNDPKLATAYKRTLDYYKDVGLSGLLASQAAYEFVVASVADSVPFMSENNKGRLARDLAAMPEAFVGGGSRNLSQLDDFFELAAKQGTQTINKTIDVADRFYIDPTTVGTIGGNFALRTPGEEGNFKKARNLFKQLGGEDPRNFVSTNTKVYNQTGWYINPSDNQWRYEISDKPAKIDFKNFQGKELLNQRQITGSELFDEIQTLADNKSIDVSLTDFFKHEELYRRYPHLKRMRITFEADSAENASLGSYHRDKNLITINPAKVDLKDKRFKEILMHEIQHSIQEYEGFIPGASAQRIPFELTEKHAKTLTSALEDARITRKELLDELDIESLAIGYDTGPLFKLLDRDQDLKPGFILFASEDSVIEKFADAAKKSGLPDNIFDIYQKEKGGIGGSPLIKISNILNELRMSHLDDVYHKEAIQIINEKLYRGSGGELEANVVGYTANINPAERGLDPINMERYIATQQKLPDDFVGSYDDMAGKAVSENQPGYSRRLRSRRVEPGVTDAKIDINFDGVYNSLDITNKGFEEMSAVQRADAFSKFLLDNIIKNNKELKSIKNLKRGDTFSYTLDNGDVVQARFKKVLMKEYKRPDIEKGEGQIILRDTDPSKYESGEKFKIPEIEIELVGDGSMPPKTQLTISMPELIKNSNLVKNGENFDIMDLQEKIPEKTGFLSRANRFLDKLGLAEGGIAMNKQMQMAFMNEGGLRDDNMEKDPVSGNEVPSGSMAKEVRDDIPAQLSEGEYVVPADVVRYYGVKFFEDLRDRAKRGLQEMEANGRIGGEPVPAGGPTNEEELSPQEMQAIREMMGMAEGGTVNMYKRQQDLYSAPQQAVGNNMMNQGGQVRGYQNSSVVTNPANNTTNITNPANTASNFEQNIITAGQQAQQNPFVAQPLGYSLFQPAGTGTQMAEVTTPTAFVPVDMINLQTNHKVKANTQKEFDEYIAKGYVVDDGTLKPDSGGGGGGGGGDDPPKPEGWKKWLESADWNSEKGIRAFVDGIDYDPTTDTTTGKSIAAGLVGGAGAGVITAGLSAKPGLTAISDLNAARLIAKAQGLDELAAELDTRVKKIIDDGPGILDYLDDIFATGKSKANAWAKTKGFDNIQAAIEAGVTPTTPTSSGNDDDPPPTATSTQAAENQATAQSILDDLANPATQTSNQTSNIVANSLNTVGEGATAEERIANQQNTIENLNQITQNLETATQNPSGTISLQEGGLASNPKKKKKRQPRKGGLAGKK
tara:strand:+ start:871 stop:4737 length:3867 start_codon:yes stop_codon:yes gene_type:complete